MFGIFRRQSLRKLLEQTPAEAALDYILRYVGTFYSWGGDDPSGFDCSGLAIEYLKSIGILNRGYDNTARGLFADLPPLLRSDRPSSGGLVFYVPYTDEAAIEREICHVEICLDEKYQLGASGGGSQVKSRDDAIRHNAFIKRRPIDSARALSLFKFVRLFDLDGNPIL